MEIENNIKHTGKSTARKIPEWLEVVVIAFALS